MVPTETLLREREEMQQQQASQQATIETQNGTIEKMRAYILQLEEYIRNGRRKQFGPSSEKLVDSHPNLFNEAEAEASSAETAEEAPVTEPSEPRARERKPRKAFRIPPELPRVEVIHDLPEDEKVCPKDGTALKHIDDEISEQLDIIPAQVQVLRHVRRTYACPCCEQHMATAAKPKQPIEKGLASPRLLATVATQKYVDGLPLYRQGEVFKRMGIELDRSTQANWMMKAGELIQPLINLIHERMLEEPVLHMDETRLQVLKEDGRTAQAQSYMWVMRSTGHPAVLYRYAPTRGGAIPKQLLEDFSGALMVDGYEGYNAGCETNSITRLGCWAHARRGFVEVQKTYGTGKTGKADEVLAHIQALYRIEQDAKDKPSDECLAMRQARAAPVLQRLRQWIDQHKERIAPKSLLGKAVHYLNAQWPRLVRYIEDGNYPIDNNPAENAIRPFVVGRKNWLFSTSPRGADASANLYSLIETAKANGVEPQVYLTRVFTQLPNATTLGEIEALLPWPAKIEGP